MKKYIKTSFSPHAATRTMMGKTRYNVHWISPDGQDCLLGGSATIDGANKIARDQADHIFDSPFETNERKMIFLENIYIVEKGKESSDCMDVDTEEYIDNLMSELHSRISLKNKDK